MSYEESYLLCDSVEKILEEANRDITLAAMIGSTDRVNVIRKTAEAVINEKFPNWEGAKSAEEMDGRVMGL